MSPAHTSTQKRSGALRHHASVVEDRSAGPVWRAKTSGVLGLIIVPEDCCHTCRLGTCFGHLSLKADLFFYLSSCFAAFCSGGEHRPRRYVRARCGPLYFRVHSSFQQRPGTGSRINFRPIPSCFGPLRVVSELMNAIRGTIRVYPPAIPGSDFASCTLISRLGTSPNPDS